MNHLKSLFWITSLWSLFSLQTFAQDFRYGTVPPDDIELGEPGYNGTGCPMGSASVTMGTDKKTLSILFGEYVVEAQGRKRVDRKNCSIRIPIKIPQGWSMSLVQLDYRGFNSLPSGARSSFNVEYFFAGQRGPRYAENFRGPLDSDYLIRNTIGIDALVWSPCGASPNLAVNSSMMTTTNSRGDQALSTVDSVDVEAGLQFHVQWKRCY